MSSKPISRFESWKVQGGQAETVICEVVPYIPKALQDFTNAYLLKAKVCLDVFLKSVVLGWKEYNVELD